VITISHATLVRTSPDKWSASRRDNTHHSQGERYI